MNREDLNKILQGIVIPEGTPVETVNKMVRPVRDAISEMLPVSLYRFRPCSDLQIDAFEKDEIYAVTADRFNDPYDTLVRYDYDGIKQYVEAIVCPEGLDQLKSFYAQGNDFPAEYKQMFSEEFWNVLKARLLEISSFDGLESKLEDSKQQLLSLISTYFPIISFYGKRFSTIACFSEDVRSILMWSHYADSQKGFALEYDFRPTLMKPLPRVGIYPVIYSDTRFDASAYLTWAFFAMMGIPAKNPDMFASTKAALYKSRLWEYEKEWRMIDPGPHDVLNPTASVVEYRPVAIYYGRNIEEKNKSRLHSIAAAKGIKEYEMYIDYASTAYEMKWREIDL